MKGGTTLENREHLIEQYDDAVFALLMDEYAESSGAELLRDYQAAVDGGLVPEFPTELDRRCRDIIHEEFRSRKRKARLRSICRWIVRIVFALFLLLGLILRTAWEFVQERRRTAHTVPETHRVESQEDEGTIFLTM